MKKSFLISTFITAGIAALAVFVFRTSSTGEFMLDRKLTEESGEKAMRAKEAAEHRYNLLKDENGEVKLEYFEAALVQANEMRQMSNRSGALGLNWEELGPDNVGGRTRAILIDKRDPSNNTIYAGGVSGGLWKSTDGANTWTRINTWNEWLTVSWIDQGPGPDYNIYVSTGEGLAYQGASKFQSGSVGNGIYKLTSNDAPVRITPSAFDGNTMTDANQWSIVNRVAANPVDASHILASTGTGLYETRDGGNSWTAVTLPAGLSGGSADVKFSKDGVHVYAVVGGTNRLVHSGNGGISWNRVSNANNPGFPQTVGRIEVAIAPSNSEIAYILVATAQGCTFGAYRTGDGGATWQTIGTKGPLFDPFMENCQGWYDNTIAVSPADPNKVYAGGVEFYTWSDQSGWKLADAGLGASEVNPNYIHPDKHTIVIADNDPNLMYIGHDGGINKSTNALSAFPFPTYVVKNRGYNVTQFYSVGAALSGEVLGGTQDNGTQYVNYKGNTKMAARRVTGGDGTYAEISHIDPRVMFAGVYFGSNYRSGNGGSSFEGFNDIKIDPQGHGQPSRCGGQEDNNAQFISPFWLFESKNAANGLQTAPFKATDRNYLTGEVVTVESKVGKFKFQHTLTSDVAQGATVQVPDPIRSRYFAHSNCGVWVTPDALELGAIPRWFRLATSLNGIPESMASTDDANTLYVGTSAGRVYKFPNFNARMDTASYLPGNTITSVYTNTSQFVNTQVTNRPIEGVSVDPTNPDHAVCVIAGFSSSNQPHVYETTNGGATWSPLTGLPNMPVYDVVVHGPDKVVVGTELGIWSWDGSQWYEENDGYATAGDPGMPRVPVFRLMEKPLYDQECKVIYAGTHGRGMWRTTTLIGNSCKTVASINNPANDNAVSNLNIFPNPVAGNGKVSLTLDKPSDVTIRIMDVTGRIYSEKVYKEGVAGVNTFDFSVDGLSNGNYMLAATVGNSRTQARLFVVNK